MSLFFLIGMPGAGKTYWGGILAERYGLAFTDLDACIAQAEGRSIREIFANEGEQYFRQKETECLHLLGDERNMIVASGGGTPVYNDNLAWMKEHGCVLYIEADMDTLVSEMTGDSQRPLLTGGDVREKLESLYNKRVVYYQQAHYTLQADETIIANFKKIMELCTGRR